MDFWNEYEGKTIAGSYPLQKLLYPEGRSGFFFTSNGTGTPAIIRLTETLNDQQEILGQWQAVRDLQHPNLVTLRNFGPTVVDDVPLIYAILEPTDASLGEILKDRAMTGEETREIAASLISALQALHGVGMIHGHVEPANIFAVGEVIKLRSDCIRKAPEGADGDRLRAIDVEALAVVLLQALTQQRSQQNLALHSPFAEIVRNGLNGSWGLSEMDRALNPETAHSLLSTLPQEKIVDPASSVATVEAEPASRDIADAIVDVERSQAELPFERLDAPKEDWPRSPGPWIAIGLLLGSVLLAGWLFAYAHKQHALQSQMNAQSVAPVAAPAVKSTIAANGAAKVIAPASPGSPVAGRSAALATEQRGREAWRVVVFTYNREDQARQKIAAIARKHNSMRPEVYTPTGHAPYLVTLGGAMTREQAETLKKKAHRAGFPRDTYAQNYSGQ